MKKPFTSAHERDGHAPEGTKPGERLQKMLARAGVASRRQCEVYIVEGRVKVNGVVVTELGTRVMPGRDRLEFDGRPVDPDAPRLRYYMLYKPTGYLSTVSDPHGRPTVLDLVHSQERLYPVGRLDYNSEGLMLLTNDGALTHRLLHPRFEHEREYVVLIPGPIVDDVVQQLERGVLVGDPPILARAQVEVLGRRWHWRSDENPPNSTWLRMVLREGHKREIRYMLQAVGYEVQRLIRVRFDQLVIGELRPSEGRWLTPREAAALRVNVGLPAQPAPLSEELAAHRQAPQRGRPRTLRPRPRDDRRRPDGAGEREGPPRGQSRSRTPTRSRTPSSSSAPSERRPAGRRPASSPSSRRPRSNDSR